MSAPAASLAALSLAAGDAFFCALAEDRTVWCWGSNRSGELGRGPAEEGRHHLPEPARVPGLDDVRQVAAGRHWAGAVRGDGSVWCWGQDGFGKVGGAPGTYLGVAGPTRVAGLDRVKQLALGESHGCALRDDGSVWCWGHDYAGKLGVRTKALTSASFPPGSMEEPSTNGRAPGPVPGVSGASTIAAFGERSAAVVAGEVWLWGRGTHRIVRTGGSGGLPRAPASDEEIRPEKVPGLSGVRSVAINDYALFALHGDGRVSVVGDAPTGKEAAGLAGALQVAAGWYGVSVLEKGGAVRAWGLLGAGVREVRHELNARSIAAGREFVGAVDAKGAVWAWGAGWAGQMGPRPGKTLGGSVAWGEPAPVQVLLR